MEVRNRIKGKAIFFFHLTLLRSHLLCGALFCLIVLALFIYLSWHETLIEVGLAVFISKKHKNRPQGSQPETAFLGEAH